MPLDERHRQQRAKNRFLLCLLLGFVAILYALAMVKFPH